jgi:exopolysaccharide biosynthesis protein
MLIKNQVLSICLAALLSTAIHLKASADWTSTTIPNLGHNDNSGVSYFLDKSVANKRIHVVSVDLSNPRIKIRTSSIEERGMTPSAFSRKTGAKVVINGDFFDGQLQPIGLAAGMGRVWTKTADTKEWSFFACTKSNDCLIEPYNQVTPWKTEWQSVVGGWQILLDPGFEWTSAYDYQCGAFCTVEHPRTAVGLSADRKTMWFVLIEGRQGALTGLSLADTTAVLKRLGAEWALNLDGGGSSTMVVDGQRISRRPHNEPAERSVANCLAVIVEPE